MKSIEIFKIIENTNLHILSLTDLGKLTNITNRNTLYKLAERLTENGILKRLTKGIYAISSKPPEIYEIANYLYSPSYVSLESALYRYGVITQAPFTITSVTVKKPKKIFIENCEFEYVHLHPKYFFGYIRDRNTLIATKGKALLDLLYLVSKKVRDFTLDNLDWNEIKKAELNPYLKFYRNYPPLHNLLKRINL